MRVKPLLGILWACVAILVALPARAADLPAGPISLVIPSATGGGYDLYSRLVARHLGRSLPGNPTVISRNMPGGGGLTAANWLYTVAPKDGSTIGMMQSASPFEPLLGNKKADFDPRRYTWLVSLNKLVNVVVVWHTSAAQTAQDLFNKEFVIGGSAPSSNPVVLPRIMNSLAGTKFKVITGYESNSQVLLAAERGEVDGAAGFGYDGLKSTRADLVREKKLRILMQVALAKHPELPDVPLVMDFIKDDDGRKIMELILARQENGRPFVAPPDLPAGAAQALRAGFAKMVTQPAFLAEANTLNLEINVSTPEEIMDLINRAYDLPASLVQKTIEQLGSASK